MGHAVERPRMTAAEYLAFEATADVRHEYINGQAYAMAGGSSRHAAIIANLIAGLHPKLRKKRCRPTSGDQLIHVTATDAYFYADVTIICGPYQHADTSDRAVTNPTVLIEVLSPSTADFDRGTKFEHYRHIESLQEYVLVHQDERHIEHRRRLEDEAWIVRRVTDGALALASVEVELSLDAIYDLEGV